MTKARATGTTGGAKGALVVGTGSTTAAALSVGTDGQFLTAASTASTGLTWSSVSIPSAVALQEQQFTANGTWTAPTGVTKAWVTIVSGGGGGGASGQPGPGAGIGGAGGAQYTGQFTVVPATGYTVTIGGGGAGGSTASAYVAQGSPGTASVFGSTTIAGGLEGRAGGANGSGFAFSTTGQSSYGIGGTVGGGSAAANSGGGGGGNYVFNSSTATGGTGGSGIVIVRWLA